VKGLWQMWQLVALALTFAASRPYVPLRFGGLGCWLSAGRAGPAADRARFQNHDLGLKPIGERKTISGVSP
jgi:hypothetical protein